MVLIQMNDLYNGKGMVKGSNKQGHIPEPIHHVQDEQKNPQNYCGYFQSQSFVAMVIAIVQKLL